MNLKVVLEPSDEGGYTAFVPSLPDTKEEVLKNIREAIELYLEEVEDDSVIGPKAEVVNVAV